ncbi:MAG TPA: hypothetical protein ENN36_01450 [Candidatus Bathyarchaeota archaeon]|nr:hypothetical protein [Candidatus Bathyarchaeota archaeon]
MKKTVLLAALSALLLAATTAPALAQYDWDVGVEVGDWFLYEPTLILWESDQVAFPPFYLQYLQTYNESSLMNYTVIDITGDVITFEVTYHWTNGTQTTTTLEENIASIESSLMVIGANLPDGAEIRPAYSLLDMWPMPARYLNESIMLETETGTRETNVLDHNSDIFNQIYHYTYYWDKETGIQVYHAEHATDVLNENQQMFSYECEVKLIDSSTGVIIPDLTGPAMLLTLMAITIPIVLLNRHKKPHTS